MAAGPMREGLIFDVLQPTETIDAEDNQDDRGHHDKSKQILLLVKRFLRLIDYALSDIVL